MIAKHRARTMAALALILLACSSFSTLQADEGEFGIQTGALWSDKQLTGESQVDPLLGLRGGYRFSQHWGWILDGWYSEVDAVDTRSGNTLSETAPTVSARTGFEVLFGKDGRKSRMFCNLSGGVVRWDFAQGAISRGLGSAGIGQRIEIGEQKYFRWEFRGDYTISDKGFDNASIAMAQLLVGLSWGVGGVLLDEDGDGIADRRDDCPDTPRGAMVTSRGCSIDSDGDGVPDGIDQCPGTQAGWPVDSKGCPLDSDGDGVADGIDECPGTPRGATVDRAGCPSDEDGDGVFDGIDRCPGTPQNVDVDEMGCPLDEDNDGVPDYLDKCPGTPAGEPVDRNGCPLDDDRDGVANSIDECPETPLNVDVDSVGCPFFIPIPGGTLLLEGVNFQFNSAELTPNGKRIVGIVARSLKAYETVGKTIHLEIRGHTDSDGEAAYNLALSQRRADAVRDLLIELKVTPDWLTAVGLGETDPLKGWDNSTAEGKAMNRRVELRNLDDK